MTFCDIFIFFLFFSVLYNFYFLYFPRLFSRMSTKKMHLVMDEQEEKHDQPWPSYHIETPKRLEVIKHRLEVSELRQKLEHSEEQEKLPNSLKIEHLSENFEKN